MGHGRMICVMNTAHGRPSSDTLPFDMQHLRHPIQYHCPDDADDAARSAVQNDLAKEFTTAIRAIITSQELLNRKDDGTTHPETTEQAVALVKQYSRSDTFSLELTELLAEECKRIRATVDSIQSPPNLTNESLNQVFEVFVSATSKLMQMLALCARWGTAEAIRTALRSIQSLSLRTQPQGGFVYLIELRDLPASLCFYAVLAGALDRQYYILVKRICDTEIVQNQDRLELVTALSMQALVTSPNGWKFLKGYETRKLSHSEPLFLIMQPVLSALNINVESQRRFFDEIEAFITIEFAHRKLKKIESNHLLWFWTTFGDYLFRNHSRNADHFLNKSRKGAT